MTGKQQPQPMCQTIKYMVRIQPKPKSLILRHQPRQKPFVVAQDRKVYKVDVLNGKLLDLSSVIANLGKPSAIDINSRTGLLYVSSEVDHKLKRHDAVVEINPSNNFAVSRILFSGQDPYFQQTDPTNRFNTSISVYSLRVHPNGKHLYIGRSLEPKKGLLTVIDLATGQFIRWSNFVLGGQSIISPDGRQAVTMWPDIHHIEQIDGQTKKRSWNAGMSIADISQERWGQVINLKGNKGFQPPWQKMDSPFIYLNARTKHLLAYDRDSGEILANISLPDMTRCTPAQTYPTLLTNPNHAALSMYCDDNAGAVVVIDVLKKKMLHKIRVGPRPTNVVIGNGQP